MKHSVACRFSAGTRCACSSVTSGATCSTSAALCSGRGCSAKNSRSIQTAGGGNAAQQVESVFDRLAPHRIAIAIELDQVALALEPVGEFLRQREPHRAHGLAGHGAARARRYR